MALATIALTAAPNTAAGIIEGMIMAQLSGVWTADLRIDQIGASLFPAGTKVTITSGGGYSRTGVVDPVRTGSRVDAVHLRVLGGAGGVGKSASARSFAQPGAFARDVVNALMTDSGETLDSTTLQSFLSTNLTAWSTIGGNSVARNLKLLLKIVAPTLNWRILANGNLWIGAETWPSASATHDVMDFDPTDGSYLLGSESPFVLPGQNVAGVGNVSRVLDVIADGRMRTHCWVDIPGTARGITDATQRMALQAFPGVDYYATYICQVQAQSADLTTVDLNPVGARNMALIGSLQRVPVRFGTGIKIQVAQGSTVLLGWDGGNPQVPFAMAGLSGDTAQKIQLGGSAHPLPLWDTFLTDLASALGMILASNGGGPIITPTVPPAVGMPEFIAKIATPAYKSQIVSNG